MAQLEGWISPRKKGRGYLWRSIGFKDDTDSRSRDYICPVCKTKNIELLPDTEPGAATSKSTQPTVVLSFGYQKDQKSTPQNTSTSSIILHSNV
jgi:hypothetical protein